jgi:hypothetical protein
VVRGCVCLAVSNSVHFCPGQWLCPGIKPVHGLGMRRGCFVQALNFQYWHFWVGFACACEQLQGFSISL